MSKIIHVLVSSDLLKRLQAVRNGDKRLCAVPLETVAALALMRGVEYAEQNRQGDARVDCIVDGVRFKG